MLKDAREISRSIDIMFEACENIRDHDRCDECPINDICLQDPDVGFMDLFEFSHDALWDEYINYADNVTFRKEDLDAQDADFRRKLDVEERGME